MKSFIEIGIDKFVEDCKPLVREEQLVNVNHIAAVTPILNNKGSRCGCSILLATGGTITINGENAYKDIKSRILEAMFY